MTHYENEQNSLSLFLKNIFIKTNTFTCLEYAQQNCITSNMHKPSYIRTHTMNMRIMRCEANDICTWLSEANGQDMAIISIASSSSGVHQQTIDRTKLLIAYNSVQEFCFLSQFEVIVYS